MQFHQVEDNVLASNRVLLWTAMLNNGKEMDKNQSLDIILRNVLISSKTSPALCKQSSSGCSSSMSEKWKYTTVNKRLAKKRISPVCWVGYGEPNGATIPFEHRRLGVLPSVLFVFHEKLWAEPYCHDYIVAGRELE